MSRELVVEDAVVAVFERRGWYQRKVQFAGVKGSPDRWFLRKGLWVLIEFKRRDRQPDGNQMRRIRELRAYGQTVYVIDNIEDGIELCDKVTDESDLRVRSAA